MDKKSFFIGLASGFVIGCVLTFVVLLVIGVASQKSEPSAPIQYLEKPVSYENKTETSFEVFQVLGDAALAHEESDRIGGDVMYLGNTVLIIGKNYYSDQVVTVKNPQRIGTYSYTNNAGMPMTVPVINGDISE